VDDACGDDDDGGCGDGEAGDTCSGADAVVSEYGDDVDMSAG